MLELMQGVGMCGGLLWVDSVVVNDWTDVGYGMWRTDAVVCWCREMETTKGSVYAGERHGVYYYFASTPLATHEPANRPSKSQTPRVSSLSNSRDCPLNFSDGRAKISVTVVLGEGGIATPMSSNIS
jgi:hypothetical protein